jgi:hypothetical protein
MFGGCSTYAQSKKNAIQSGIVGGVSLALMVPGIGVALSDPRLGGGSRTDDEGLGHAARWGAVAIAVLAFWPFAVGTTIALGSLVGMAVYDKPPEEDRRVEDPKTTRVRRTQAEAKARELARTLTKHAAESARAGDCAPTTALAPELRELEPEFYEAVFVHNAAIKRCLEGTAPSQPAPAEPPMGSP